MDKVVIRYIIFKNCNRLHLDVVHIFAVDMQALFLHSFKGMLKIVIIPTTGKRSQARARNFNN